MNKIKALLIAVAMTLGLVGVSVATDTPIASAEYGCGTFGVDPGGSSIAYADAYCNGLNPYSPYFGQTGQQVRIKIKCATIGGTNEPNFRYGNWTPYVGSFVGSTFVGGSSEVRCDNTYPKLSTLPREYEISTWTAPSVYPQFLDDPSDYHHWGGRTSAGTLATNQWIRVVVVCGAGAPVRYGPKVYVTTSNSYYYCGTTGGDLEWHASTVTSEVGYN